MGALAITVSWPEGWKLDDALKHVTSRMPSRRQVEVAGVVAISATAGLAGYIVFRIRSRKRAAAAAAADPIHNILFAALADIADDEDTHAKRCVSYEADAADTIDAFLRSVGAADGGDFEEFYLEDRDAPTE